MQYCGKIVNSKINIEWFSRDFVSGVILIVCTKILFIA